MSGIPEWVLAGVEGELSHARQKFPGNALLNLALQEEIGELARAQLEHDWPSVEKEAMQCIAVLIRIITEKDGSVEVYHAGRQVESAAGSEE